MLYLEKMENVMIKTGVILLGLFFLTACSVVGQSKPTQFYIMTEAPTSLLASHTLNLPKDLQIGIGPIEIPGYSDRSQIVTIGEGAKLDVADLDHWAEPVQNNIERILVGNISTLISNHQVFPYPTNFHPGAESLQIAVEIRDMIQTETGRIRLVASWNIKRMRNNQLLQRESQTYEKQEVSGDFGAYATGLSELFGRLAIDIAGSIEKAR